MTLSDTTPTAAAAQRAAFARMSGSERVLAAIEMSEQAKEITLQGIRHRNPGFDEKTVHAEWLRLLHGPELAAKLIALL